MHAFGGNVVLFFSPPCRSPPLFILFLFLLHWLFHSSSYISKDIRLCACWEKKKRWESQVQRGWRCIPRTPFSHFYFGSFISQQVKSQASHHAAADVSSSYECNPLIRDVPYNLFFFLPYPIPLIRRWPVVHFRPRGSRLIDHFSAAALDHLRDTITHLYRPLVINFISPRLHYGWMSIMGSSDILAR